MRSSSALWHTGSRTRAFEEPPDSLAHSRPDPSRLGVHVLEADRNCGDTSGMTTQPISTQTSFGPTSRCRPGPGRSGGPCLDVVRREVGLAAGPQQDMQSVQPAERKRQAPRPTCGHGSHRPASGKIEQRRTCHHRLNRTCDADGSPLVRAQSDCFFIATSRGHAGLTPAGKGAELCRRGQENTATGYPHHR